MPTQAASQAFNDAVGSYTRAGVAHFPPPTMQHWQDVRRLAAELGTPRAKQATFNAIEAVISHELEGWRYQSEKQCWEVHHASQSNYYQWKRRTQGCVRQPPVAPLTRSAVSADPRTATYYLWAQHASTQLPPPIQRALSEEERGLGATRRDNSDGDGPSLGEALRASKQKGSPPPARPQTGIQEPSKFWQANRGRSISAPHEPEPLGARTQMPSAAATSEKTHKKLGKRKMPVLDIAGETYAAPIGRPDRPVSLRKASMLQLARDRAARMAPAQASDEQRARLTGAVLATHELAEYGAATGTLDIDDLAWKFWGRFCALYGWSPTFQADADWARTHQDEISQRLAIFQAWVYPQLNGRGGRVDAKPRTVFNNYVLAILRILGREHLPLPKAKHVEKNLSGLMRSFKEIYGVEALMPGRKQPLTPAMWAAIEGLKEGRSMPGRPDWSPKGRFRDRTLLRLGRVLWRTGHRMGEICFHRSGEVNYLTRKSVSIRKANGRVIATPTGLDWQALAPGDIVWLAPCASKSDQFGEEHCPFPSVLPFNGSHTCAAAAIRDIELELPCEPHKRGSTPLFCDEELQPFTYAVLHTELRKLLSALYNERMASVYSWHSIRIGLACSLHAADCPDAVIQLICRWASPSSLRVYRQMGIEKNVFWTERAQRVQFDAARVNNIPALDNTERMTHNVREFAGDSDVAAGVALASNVVADAATPVMRPAPDSNLANDVTASRAARTYAIPGGTVMASGTDANMLVGLQVGIFNNLWAGYERNGGRTKCPVIARCLREFRHPDNERCLTYLIEYGGLYYPIKHASLLACVSLQVRCNLPAQRSL